jgi:hypothetical protein
MTLDDVTQPVRRFAAGFRAAIARRIGTGS